jgi:hypothetical protein
MFSGSKQARSPQRRQPPGVDDLGPQIADKASQLPKHSEVEPPPTAENVDWHAPGAQFLRNWPFASKGSDVDVSGSAKDGREEADLSAGGRMVKRWK